MPIIWKCNECPAQKTREIINDGWTIDSDYIGGSSYVRCPECSAKHRATLLPKMSEDEEKAIDELGKIFRKNSEKDAKGRSP